MGGIDWLCSEVSYTFFGDIYFDKYEMINQDFFDQVFSHSFFFTPLSLSLSLSTCSLVPCPTISTLQASQSRRGPLKQGLSWTSKESMNPVYSYVFTISQVDPNVFTLWIQFICMCLLLIQYMHMGSHLNPVKSCVYTLNTAYLYILTLWMQFIHKCLHYESRIQLIYMFLLFESS